MVKVDAGWRAGGGEPGYGRQRSRVRGLDFAGDRHGSNVEKRG